MDLIATQAQRGRISRLIREWEEDIIEFEEIREKTPLTTEKYKFSDNREYIIQDKLYGLLKSDARRIITAFTKNVGEEEEQKAVNIIVNKLK